MHGLAYIHTMLKTCGRYLLFSPTDRYLPSRLRNDTLRVACTRASQCEFVRIWVVCVCSEYCLNRTFQWSEILYIHAFVCVCTIHLGPICCMVKISSLSKAASNPNPASHIRPIMSRIQKERERERERERVARANEYMTTIKAR